MSRRHTRLVFALASLVLALPAFAQLETVPMRGLGNEWVKKLDLRGRMDWEWIETYPTQVYFATRHDSERNGDIVTMWTRVEYRNVQSPSSHFSSVSRDDWDCKKRQRSTRGLVFYQWNNLEDSDPEHSTNLLRYWEKIERGTVGETLLNFACSIRPVLPLITPEPKS